MKVRPMISYFRIPMALVLLSLPGVIAGCSSAEPGDVSETVISEAEPISQGVLDNALLNESQFAEAGYVLEGRAWVTPDVGLSFYLDQAQNRFYSVLMRGGAEVDPEQLATDEAEDFASFVTRKGEGFERLVDVGSTGPNVLLFDPAEAAAKFESTNRLTAVGRNDYCPRSWFDARCTQWAGWHNLSAPSFVLTWNITDRTASSTQSRSDVTGVVATGCADVGTIDYSLTISNSRWGTVPGSVALTLNQGNAYQVWASGGWREEEYCKTSVLGVCVDYAFRIKFQTFNASARITPRAGAEGHFCGKMVKNDDYYQGDIACRRILTCPVQCPPGSTSADCRL